MLFFPIFCCDPQTYLTSGVKIFSKRGGGDFFKINYAPVLPRSISNLAAPARGGVASGGGEIGRGGKGWEVGSAGRGWDCWPRLSSSSPGIIPFRLIVDMFGSS